MLRFALVSLVLCVALVAPAPAAGLMLRVPVGEVSVGSSSTKTIVMVTAPTNQKLKVKLVSVAADGVDSTQPPLLVELMKFTTAGTFTSATPVKLNQDDAETPQSTAGKDASAEPTGGDVYLQREIAFHSGSVAYQYGFGDELRIKGGERVGVRVTNTGSISVNVLVDLVWEE